MTKCPFLGNRLVRWWRMRRLLKRMLSIPLEETPLVKMMKKSGEMHKKQEKLLQDLPDHPTPEESQELIEKFAAMYRELLEDKT